jgi:hypothetical protein
MRLLTQRADRLHFLSFHKVLYYLYLRSNVHLLPKIFFPLIIACLFAISCKEEKKETPAKATPRVLPGFHPLLDQIIRDKAGVFRGLDLNASAEQIKKVEGSEPIEESQGHLYYEYQADSITNYSIDYTLNNDSLEEINVQINTNDLDLGSYLFCDLKDYYANKLPNPTEDKGYVVYNCFEGQRKPFVVSLSDNSSPAKGIINMVIYKDK